MTNHMKFLVTLVFAICTFFVQAQTEEEVKETATKLFERGAYVEATPYYLRLLSLQPKSSLYNYRYGACLLYNSNQKQDALRYLKFAVQDSAVEPLAHYFMGRAYHLNYLFSDALQAYKKFNQVGSSADRKRFEIDRLMEMTKNGQQLLTKFSDLVVFDKKEIEQEKFFRLYDLSDIGGNLLVTADFQTKIDKKNNHTPLIYFSPNSKTIYYSSYGESESSGKDIYRRKRFAGGGWGEPQIVQGGVNTPYDEDFAYMSQDGKYLYFSSKGHNSMGGYDIFRAEIDEKSGVFGPAENLDFSISSPDDDILFLVDKTNENGYFASARESESGKLNVYKIRVDRIPAKLKILAGTFNSELDPENAKLMVKVSDKLSGKAIGTFKANAGGQMVITVPKEGEYTYEMTVVGNEKIHIFNVGIPKTETIRPLQQNFLHVRENGEDKIKVTNQFQSTVDNADELMANAYANQAKLKPNSDDIDPELLASVKDRKNALAQVGAPDQELDAFAAEMKLKIEKMRKNLELAEQFEKKTVFAIEAWMDEIEALDQELEAEATEYESAVTVEQKSDIIQTTKTILDRQETIYKKISLLSQLNKEIQNDQKTQSPLVYEEWKKLAEEMFVLADAGKDAEALAILTNHQEDFKELVAASEVDYQTTSVTKMTDLTASISRLNKEKFEYKRSLTKAESELNSLEQQRAKVKKKNAEALESEIASKMREVALLKDELNRIDAEVIAQKSEKDNLTINLSNYNKYSSVESQTSETPFPAVQRELTKLISKKQSTALDYLLQDVETFELEGKRAFQNESLQKEIAEQRKLEAYLSDYNPKYSDEIYAVKQKSEWDITRKTEELVKVEQANLLVLEQELDLFNQKFPNADADPELAAQKQVLEDLVQAAREKLSAYKADEALAQNLTADGMLKLLDNGYSRRMENITNNLDKTDSERLTLLNREDRKMLDVIQQRQQAIQENINNQTGNADLLQNELDLLNSIQSSIQKKVVSRERQIADLKENEALLTDEPGLSQGSSSNESNAFLVSEVGELNDGYAKLSDEERQASFKNMVAKELFDELEQMQGPSPEKAAVQERLLAYINEHEIEILSATANVKKNDKNQFIADYEAMKLSLVNDLSQDTESGSLSASDLPTSDNQLGELSAAEVPETGSVLMKEVDLSILDQAFPDYRGERAEIIEKNTDRKAQLTALVALEETFMAKGEKELQKLKKSDNESNEQINLSQAIKILEIQKQKEIILMRILPESNADLSERLVPGHASKVESISNDFTLTEQEKNKAFNDADKSLIAAAELDMTELAAYRRLQPNNKALLEKERELNEFINAARLRQISREEIDRNATSSNDLTKMGEESTKDESARKDVFGQGVAESTIDPFADKQAANQARKLAATPPAPGLAEVRSEVLNGSENPLTKELASIEEKKENIGELKSYRARLAEYAENLDAEGSADALNIYKEIAQIDERQQIIEEELAYEAQVSRIEEKNSAVFNDSSSNNPELLAAATEEIKLTSALNNSNLSDKEAKKLEKQLEKARQAKFEQENSALKDELLALKLSNLATWEKLDELKMVSPNAQANYQMAKRHYASLQEEARILELASTNASEPGKVNELLLAAINRHKLAETTLEMTYLDNKVENVTTGSLQTLDVYTELQESNRALQVAKANVQADLEVVQQELSQAKKSKEKDALKAKRKSLMADVERYDDQIQYVNKKLNEIPDRVPATISNRANQVELTAEEEATIASTELYQQMVRLTNDALFLEGEIARQQKLLDERKSEVEEVMRMDLVRSTRKTTIEIKSGLIEIMEMEKSLSELQKRLKKKQFEINSVMPVNPEEYHKIQNMILREVTSTYRDAGPLASVEIPQSGFSVDMSQVKADDAPVPAPEITDELPNGLLFRVQLGAFSDPIETNLFKEFTPVTGENRPNGLTVYMAGFFESSQKARDAKAMIREIGYKDAFVVAYCDGERITLREAQQLELSLNCEPISLEDLRARGIPTQQSQQKKINYNDVPGAAPAQAAEGIDGLFYSVQVGVYNSVVGEEKLKNLEEVVTQRLSNGYVRYATGQFDNLEGARERKNEARQKGFDDAFVTAFYNGERITVKRAAELLKENGNAVFAIEAVSNTPKNTTVAMDEPNAQGSDSPTLNPSEGTGSNEEKEAPGAETKEEPVVVLEELEAPKKAPIGMQLVSKKKYKKYPRDVLNRYNRYGDFFYDATDERIKTKLYTSKSLMPDVYLMRNEVDTVMTLLDGNWINKEKSAKRTVSIRVVDEQIPGAVANVLLSVQTQKKYKRLGNGYEILIVGVNKSEIERLKAQLSALDLSMKELPYEYVQ